MCIAPRVRERTSKSPNGETGGSFEAFWTAYPKKRGKQDAMKAWGKLNPDEITARRIVQQVQAAASTHDWRKSGGQYIPLPATYLNGRRFDDELAVSTTQHPAMVAL